MIYSNVTRGFKAGNFVNITALFSDSLKPIRQETVTSFELGFKISGWQSRLQLTGSAFYYDYKDKQITGFRDGGFLGTINSVVSIPKSRVIGAEIETMVKPVKGLTLRGGVTYTNLH